LRAAEKKHHQDTQLIFDENGKLAGVLKLPPPTKKVLSDAMAALHEEMFMGEYGVYPDSKKAELMTASVVRAVAKDLPMASEVYARIQSDDKYFLTLSQFVS
jgi:hypothetical protein